MYDRILVPTDGSAEGERAVEHAIALAATHGATLEAVYVVNTTTYGGLPMETTWEEIDDALREEGQAAVARVEELAERGGVLVETSIVEGTPSRAIVSRAGAGGCDLVVMGTHGRGGINRLLLGSVAERVVRSSPVPVLTVRVGGDSGERAAAVGEATAE